MKRYSEENEEFHKRFKNDDEDNSNDEVKKTDIQVLTALKDKLDGETINKDVEKIRQQYLINYMKTVIEKLPLSQQLIDTTNIHLDDGDEYLKMYSIARTCVHTQMQVQKIDTFNAIFDMMTRIIGKGVHDRIIAPYLRNVVSKNNLDLAYSSFQEALSTNNGDSNLCTELHCITYLIQNEMEKSKPLKIPNPIFNRFAQQLKATSRYVTTILSSLASQPILPFYDSSNNNILIHDNINNNSSSDSNIINNNNNNKNNITFRNDTNSNVSDEIEPLSTPEEEELEFHQPVDAK